MGIVIDDDHCGDGAWNRRERVILTGDVFNPIDRPPGCPFHPRCPHIRDKCLSEPPVLTEVAPGREVACHFPPEVQEGDAALGH